MQGTKEIKRRIKSVKSTKKITKAMELVAASKMKRAVSSTLSSRLYAEYSWDVLTSVAESVEEISNPLFVARPVKSTLIILITSNRGLCGAYNAQVIKKTLAILKEAAGAENVANKGESKIDILAIGKKGDNAMRRIGKNIIASFTELPNNISLSDVTPISKLSVDEFIKGNYDRIVVIYTDYVSAVTQRVNVKQILPVSKSDLKEILENAAAENAARNVGGDGVGENSSAAENTPKKNLKSSYLIEGDKDILLGSLAEKLSRMQIYQMLLESNASEQSSRMLAMKNASDAAGEMIDDLTLVFNKARQSSITQEISEISAGMASIN